MGGLQKKIVQVAEEAERITKEASLKEKLELQLLLIN